jgi:hypothetical protein
MKYKIAQDVVPMEPEEIVHSLECYPLVISCNLVMNELIPKLDLHIRQTFHGLSSDLPLRYLNAFSWSCAICSFFNSSFTSIDFSVGKKIVTPPCDGLGYLDVTSLFSLSLF